MFYQRLATSVTAVALLLAAAAARAQPAPEPAPADMPATETPAAPIACCTIPARTPIEIEIVDTVNSRANHPGDHFAIRLTQPVIVDGHVMVPAGTTGIGEVVHAARARAMGKAGELILAARYLELNGTRIPLRTLRVGPQQGRDHSGTMTTLNVVAAATVPALSLVAFVIAGGEVNVPAGTPASAQIAGEQVLAPVG